MIRKMLAVLAVTASMVGLLGTGTALAADLDGSGPAQATAPSVAYTPLAPGETKWYAFSYLGDESQIEVSMSAVPDAGSAFSIWTPEEVSLYAAGASVEPIGRGSADTLWSGNFNQAGTYYAVVENTGADTIWYTIDVSGSGVFSEQAVVAESAAAALPAAETAAIAAPAAGKTYDQALAIPGGPVAIAAGATTWHQFNYAGDESQIRIWLDAQDQGGFAFTVHTPEEMAAYTLHGATLEAIGRGACDANAAGDLTWSGSFPQAGVYYVLVSNSNGYDTTYTLNISGNVW